ncbi:helix-turn-helix domain-containing protein [Paenarthrobacter sp. 2TAF44]|uniref:helix-turn-helix domain-containing protein n=1 Tax=Paenarthrobacter sp. 2TAF44 TaxID=3233018 RepID=UPI003F997081
MRQTNKTINSQETEDEHTMTMSAATKETFLAPEAPQTGKIYNFMEAHAEKNSSQPSPQFFLSGADAGDQVEIPHEIYEVLVKAVEAMRKGLAITITPSSMTLTTQQAAELLGVTRPTIVRLLDAGKIPFEKPGTHRRIKLEDVLAFKEVRKAEQYEALDSMGTTDDEDPESAINRMKKARAVAAERRRQHKG